MLGFKNYKGQQRQKGSRFMKSHLRTIWVGKPAIVYINDLEKISKEIKQLLEELISNVRLIWLICRPYRGRFRGPIIY